MNKKCIVTVASAMLFLCTLLPGCTKLSGESGVADIMNTVTQPETQPTTQPLESNGEIEEIPLTLKDKVESILTGVFASGSWYSDGEVTWAWIDHVEYCVGAVFPSDNWTPAEVVQSYTENSAPWVRSGINMWSLWSSDYEHRFDIKHYDTISETCDYWLYVDGYRTLPVRLPVGDISPENAVRLYISGEWDGKEQMICEECPGIILAGIDYRGGLLYHYDVHDMTEEVAESARDIISSWDHVYRDNYDREWTACTAFIYPDWPDAAHQDYLVGRCKNSNGTYFAILEVDDTKIWAKCTGVRVVLYERGELVQSWDLTPERDTWGSMTNCELMYEDEECYFFYQDTLWRLLDDGSVELIMKDIVGSGLFWDRSIRAYYNIDDEFVCVPPLSHEELEWYFSE